MSARLDELRQQRALLQEHLAWLDREIAREATSSSTPATAASATPAASVKVTPASPTPVTAGSSSSVASTVTATAASTPTTPTSTSAPAPSIASPSSAPAPTDPEAILEKYRTGTDSLRTDVRKGCLLYFFGALALLSLGVAALYYALSGR